MKKRWISIVLIGLMLVSLLALPVSAEGDDPTSPASTEPVTEPATEPMPPTSESTTPPTIESTTPPTIEETNPPTGDGEEECQHEQVDIEITKEPTCAEYGTAVCTCRKCGTSVSVPLEKLEHTYDSDCDPSCNVCGALREAEHKFSAGWDYNSTKHWHVCTRCGAKKDEGSHYPGPLPTEDKDQICLTCGKVMMRRLSHTHKKSDQWSYDENGHWHACDGCDEELEFAPHRFDGSCGSPCLDCGYIPEDGHVYGDTWTGNEEEHWQICTQCGAESAHEPHALGPGGTLICPVCGNAPAALEADHEHAFSTDWMNTDTHHWHECACGEKADQAPHTWDKGKTVGDSIIHTCTACGYEKTEAAPPAAFSIFPIIFAVLGVILVGLIIALLAVLGVFGKKKNKGHFSK